jgi:glycosyltransferase involved in cell wall biosynthesis
MEFSLTVCIPAYNEAQNIERVLRAVLAQKERGFVLSEVLVYSDASLDKTAEIARGIGDKRIKVLEGQRRAGKASAINHMLRIATSDAVLLLDADSVIKSSEICNKLVSCMGQEGASLVSGSSKPLPAKTFMQKFLVFGVEAWQDLINRTPNSDMYR